MPSSEDSSLFTAEGMVRLPLLLMLVDALALLEGADGAGGIETDVEPSAYVG
jgi:hypothetical protein